MITVNTTDVILMMDGNQINDKYSLMGDSMKRVITGGVSYQNGSYKFDYTYNYPTDILHLFHRKVYQTAFKGSVYYFGYEFNKDTSSKERTKFIHYIKGLGDTKPSKHELTQFIENPLVALNSKFNLDNIDCFVYPISERSNLVQTIVDTINGYASRDAHKASYTLVKSAPTDIEFDWEAFDADFEQDSNQYKQIKKYIEETMLPAIKNLDYFSIAKNVKPKYRKYIKNILNMSEEDILKFSRLKGSKILIVDDINTSGSTLNEILRVLRKINNECEIFIFTLIGNFEK